MANHHILSVFPRKIGKGVYKNIFKDLIGSICYTADCTEFKCLLLGDSIIR